MTGTENQISAKNSREKEGEESNKAMEHVTVEKGVDMAVAHLVSSALGLPGFAAAAGHAAGAVTTVAMHVNEMKSNPRADPLPIDPRGRMKNNPSEVFASGADRTPSTPQPAKSARSTEMAKRLEDAPSAGTTLEWPPRPQFGIDARNFKARARLKKKGI